MEKTNIENGMRIIKFVIQNYYNLCTYAVNTSNYKLIDFLLDIDRVIADINLSTIQKQRLEKLKLGMNYSEIAEKENVNVSAVWKTARQLYFKIYDSLKRGDYKFSDT